MFTQIFHLIYSPLFLLLVNLTDSQKKWFVEYFQKLCSSGLTETKNKVNHFQVCILIDFSDYSLESTFLLRPVLFWLVFLVKIGAQCVHSCRRITCSTLFFICRDSMLITKAWKKPDVQKFERIVLLIFRFVLSFIF